MANVLLLDNIDSFTYNLVDQLRTQGHNVIIYRNTVNKDVILKALNELSQPILLLSPGPGKPAEAGCMPSVIKSVLGIYPVIGICLGHQAIIEAYGGSLKRANQIKHGKTSVIQHDDNAMYQGLSSPLIVARYHSLIASSVPTELIINSWCGDIVMSVRNDKDKVCGFQFHPESILTPEGARILDNTLTWASNVSEIQKETGYANNIQ